MPLATDIEIAALVAAVMTTLGVAKFAWSMCRTKGDASDAKTCSESSDDTADDHDFVLHAASTL